MRFYARKGWDNMTTTETVTLEVPVGMSQYLNTTNSEN